MAHVRAPQGWTEPDLDGGANAFERNPLRYSLTYGTLTGCIAGVFASPSPIVGCIFWSVLFSSVLRYWLGPRMVRRRDQSHRSA